MPRSKRALAVFSAVLMLASACSESEPIEHSEIDATGAAPARTATAERPARFVFDGLPLCALNFGRDSFIWLPAKAAAEFEYGGTT